MVKACSLSLARSVPARGAPCLQLSCRAAGSLLSAGARRPACLPWKEGLDSFSCISPAGAAASSPDAAPGTYHGAQGRVSRRLPCPAEPPGVPCEFGLGFPAQSSRGRPRWAGGLPVAGRRGPRPPGRTGVSCWRSVQLARATFPRVSSRGTRGWFSVGTETSV